jgi:DNA-binding transcriptional regulator YdaS (Cro superfamily)
VSYVQAAEDFGVHQSQLRGRVKGTRPVNAAGLRMTARRDGKTLRPALRPNVEFSELLPTVR